MLVFPNFTTRTHYHRGMRLHKQAFEALLRFRILEYDDLGKLNDTELVEAICILREHVSLTKLNELIEVP